MAREIVYTCDRCQAVCGKRVYEQKLRMLNKKGLIDIDIELCVHCAHSLEQWLDEEKETVQDQKRKFEVGEKVCYPTYTDIHTVIISKPDISGTIVIIDENGEYWMPNQDQLQKIS